MKNRINRKDFVETTISLSRYLQVKSECNKHWNRLLNLIDLYEDIAACVSLFRILFSFISLYIWFN